MSDNNLHKIFTPTACISSNTMMDYLQGKLSEKEKNAVEMHLASCKLCSDEMEGLSLLQNPTELTAIVANLNSKIDRKVSGGGKKIWMQRPIFKAAAAVLVLITTAWLLQFYFKTSSGHYDSEEMMSYAIEEEKTAEDSIEEKETPPTSEKVSKELASELTDEKKVNKTEFKKLQKIEIIKEIADNEKNDTDEYMDEEIAVEDYVAASSELPTISKESVEEVIAKKEINQLESAKEGELAEDIENPGNKGMVSGIALDDTQENYTPVYENKTRSKKRLSKAKASEDKVVMSNTVMPDNFDQAMAAYNNKRYLEAVKLLKNSIKQHSYKDEVHFYLANSYVNLNDTKNAISNYNKVIEVEASPYYEKALWNKSQLLIEMEKRKSAINSLNQLKKRKGDYKRRAVIVLDSLKVN